MEGQFGNRDKWREAGLRWVEAVFLPLKVTPCCIVFPMFRKYHSKLCDNIHPTPIPVTFAAAPDLSGLVLHLPPHSYRDIET